MAPHHSKRLSLVGVYSRRARHVNKNQHRYTSNGQTDVDAPRFALRDGWKGTSGGGDEPGRHSGTDRLAVTVAFAGSEPRSVGSAAPLVVQHTTQAPTHDGSPHALAHATGGAERRRVAVAVGGWGRAGCGCIRWAILLDCHTHTKPATRRRWELSLLAGMQEAVHPSHSLCYINTRGRAGGAGRAGSRGQARAYGGLTAELHAANGGSGGGGGGGGGNGAEETFPRTTSAPPLLRQAFGAANEHFGLNSLGSNSSTVEYNRHQVRI